MNLPTHHLSGQISGQALNQAGTSVPGLAQQNGNSLPGQMQNPSIHRGVPCMDPEFAKERRYMAEKILEFLNQQRQQSQEVPVKKMMDLVRRLDEGLVKCASSKEEYLNLSTLESRLQFLIKGSPMSNQNQQFSHANTSASIGTMISTPGLMQPGNSSLIGTSSVDSSVIANNTSNIPSSNVNSGGFKFMSTGNGSSGSVHGCSFSSSDGTYKSCDLSK